MIGSRRIITGRFRTVRTDEHGTSVPDVCQVITVPFALYDQMLRSVLIDQTDGFASINDDDTTVRQSLIDDRASGQLGFLRNHRFLASAGKLQTVADQYSLAVGTVFGLGQQISGYKFRIGCVISPDQYFRWSCRHIDRRSGGLHHKFGVRHVLITRTKYFIHFGYGTDSRSRSTNGLTAADSENIADSAERSCVQNSRMDLSMQIGRRTYNNVFATRQ